MTPFQWTLEIFDKASKPARDAASASDAYAESLKKVDEEIKKLKADPAGFLNLSRARKELSDLKKQLTTVQKPPEQQKKSGLLSAVADIRNIETARLIGDGLRLAYDAGLKVVDVIGEIGSKFIEATGQEQRFRIAADSLYGAQSDDVQQYVDQVAKYGELTDGQLKQMTLQLKTSGFAAEELGQVLPAALDIGGFLGGGVANIQSATDALSRMRLTGEASKRSLLALGLSEKQVLDQLKSDTGKSVETLKKEMGDGKLNPRTLLRAVYEQVAAKEGGLLGATAEKMGQTIEARLTKLKNLPDQFFRQLVTSKGFDAFSDFLGKLVGELSPDSNFGKEVTKGLSEIGDVIADTLGVKGGDAIDTTKALLRETVAAAKDIVPVMVEIAGAIADMARGAAEVIHYWQEIKGGKHAIANNTVNDNSPEWKLRKAELTRNQVGVEANSPDWKLKQAGLTREQAAGLDKSIPTEGFYGPQMPTGVQRATIRHGGMEMTDDQAIPSQASRVQPGGARVSQSAQVVVHVHAPNGDADEIADALNQSLPGAVQQSFERMAVSSGVM